MNNNKTNKEAEIEHKPFKEVFISKPELNLSYQAEIKRRMIRNGVCSLNSQPNEKLQSTLNSIVLQNKAFKTINGLKKQNKPINAFRTIQVKDRDRDRAKCTIQSAMVSKASQTFIIPKHIPKVILSYCDPYEYRHINNNAKRTKYKFKPRYIQSANNTNRRGHHSIQTEETHYDDQSLNQHQHKDKDNQQKGNKTMLNSIELSPGFDSELIARIAKEKRMIDIQLSKLKAKQDSAVNGTDTTNNNPHDPNNASSYINYHNNYKKLIPNDKRLRIRTAKSVFPRKTNKYKSLQFKKDCIFNNEYNSLHSNKPKRKLKLKSQYLFTPPVVSVNNTNITNQFSSISRNLKAINKTMIQDKRWSQRLLKGELNRRQRKEHPETAFINNEIKQAKFTAVEIEEKGLKEKVAVNALGHLKEVLLTMTKKEKDPLAKTLDSTIMKFCSKGNFDVFIKNKNKHKMSDYEWRIKRNEEDNKKAKSTLKMIEDNNYKIKYIQRQIKSIN